MHLSVRQTVCAENPASESLGKGKTHFPHRCVSAQTQGRLMLSLCFPFYRAHLCFLVFVSIKIQCPVLLVGQSDLHCSFALSGRQASFRSSVVQTVSCCFFTPLCSPPAQLVQTGCRDCRPGSNRQFFLIQILLLLI